MRESNDLAIGLYESLGYKVYRRVIGYYGGGPKEPDEDAFGTFFSSRTFAIASGKRATHFLDSRLDEHRHEKVSADRQGARVVEATARDQRRQELGCRTGSDRVLGQDKTPNLVGRLSK